jgi:DNA mismatch endonuclease (patch repair protein)
MVDPLSTEERSALMAKVKSAGNRSTELRVEQALTAAGIGGWEKHPHLPGKPDFYFPAERLVVFVDGCYWHGCPKHVRYPAARADYWRAKIDRNRRRDNRNRRALRAGGYHVMRVWEHDLKRDTWLKRLAAMLRRIRASQAVGASDRGVVREGDAPCPVILSGSEGSLPGQQHERQTR